MKNKTNKAIHGEIQQLPAADRRRVAPRSLESFLLRRVVFLSDLPPVISPLRFRASF